MVSSGRYLCASSGRTSYITGATGFFVPYAAIYCCSYWTTCTSIHRCLGNISCDSDVTLIFIWLGFLDFYLKVKIVLEAKQKMLVLHKLSPETTKNSWTRQCCKTLGRRCNFHMFLFLFYAALQSFSWERELYAQRPERYHPLLKQSIPEMSNIANEIIFLRLRDTLSCNNCVICVWTQEPRPATFTSVWHPKRRT